MNEPGENYRRKKEDLIAIYEKLRAAEKNRSSDFPFSDWTMDVHVDWAALERRALQPSLPERVRNFGFAIAPRLVAGSIIGPVIGIIAIFFWLRDVPVEFSPDFSLRVITGAAVMVLMFIWAAVAAQAMNRLAFREAPQPVLASGGMLLGFFAVTFLVSTSVMAMATYSSRAPQRRFLHSIDFMSGPQYLSLIRSRQGDADADRWTRLAEREIRRANLREAELVLARVMALDDVPSSERARADVLRGYIDARVTWQTLLAAPDAQRHVEAVSRLDEAIDNVNGASRTLGSDPRVLLSYLYLARAAATEDPAERAKWREEAIEFSLHALDAARAVPAKDVR